MRLRSYRISPLDKLAEINWFIVTIATTLLVHVTAAAAASVGPPLLNGVGLTELLSWGKTDARHTQYEWPVYEGADYQVPFELLRSVRAAGFDFVRLSVDPGPFLAFKGSQQEKLDQRLIGVIGQIRSVGLDVLVDFHPISMVQRYSAEQLESEGVDGLFGAYTDMIRHSARLLSRLDPKHVAIEPMNEPQHGYGIISAWRWQGMMERLYEAVRVESSDLTIVVTGGRGGNIDGLVQLDPGPFSEGDVRFSYHYYLPYVFSQQGVIDPHKNGRILAFTSGLPYPVKPEDFAAFWPVVAQRVTAAANLTAEEKDDILANGRKQLADYFHGGGTHARISADFDRVSQWATRYHLYPGQLFMGEFGVTQKGPSNEGAQPEDRARWLTDVRQEAQKRGFHWSLWVLTGRAAMGMTLVSVTDKTRIDPLTAHAVGKSAE